MAHRAGTVSKLKHFTWSRAVGCSFLMLSIFMPRAGYASFVDPLDAPAIPSLTPTEDPMIALARTGDHLVAVGLRGEVLVSNKTFNSWHQASTPVQSDLLAAAFPDDNDGWICGHDGVVLHSTDGGLSWTKQLDGISAKAAFEAYYDQRIAAGDQSLSADLQQIQLNYKNGPTLPWLGISFESTKTGYVVGAFGNIAVTKDGGKTWQPWLDHIDNPNFLDLNDITAVNGNIYIVGEQGMVYRLDPAKQKFIALPTGYAGSFFGLTGTAKTLIAFGMRGTVFRSTDQGKSWVQSVDSSTSSIMSGSVLTDGRFALVDIDGEILISDDDGETFAPSANRLDVPLSDISDTGRGNVVLTSLDGIRYISQQ